MANKTTTLETAVEVVIGTPIYRRGAFILDKFLSNQKEIQNEYANCSLVFATNELDFADELKQYIHSYGLTAKVITYETDKPDYARSSIWNIVSAREALRRYALSSEARYLLFLDADMIYDPAVVSIMRRKVKDCDVAQSGYLQSRVYAWGFGAGCLMLNKHILSKVSFRCFEFRNGEVLTEDEVLDMDLFCQHARVRRGIFVRIKHYMNAQEYRAIEPQPVGRFRRITNSLMVRYILMRSSIWLGHNMAGKLHGYLHGRLPARYR